MPVDQHGWWDTLTGSNLSVWLTGIGGFFGLLAGAVTTLRKASADAVRARDEGRLSVAKQISVDVEAAFLRKEAEIVALRAELAKVEADRDAGWDAARGMEDWARLLVRHEYGAALAQLDAAYRMIGWLIEKPMDEMRHVQGVALLANRLAGVDVVVPSLAEIKGKRP
jgi:hypothetical protein